jgi:hypothetical protein
MWTFFKNTFFIEWRWQVFYLFSSFIIHNHAIHDHAILSCAFCFLFNVLQYLFFDFESSLMIVLIIVFIDLKTLRFHSYSLLPYQPIAIILHLIKHLPFKLFIMFPISLATRPKWITMAWYRHLRMYTPRFMRRMRTLHAFLCATFPWDCLCTEKKLFLSWVEREGVFFGIFKFVSIVIHRERDHWGVRIVSVGSHYLSVGILDIYYVIV